MATKKIVSAPTDPEPEEKVEVELPTVIATFSCDHCHATFSATDEAGLADIAKKVCPVCKAPHGSLQEVSAH
jgi:rubrerythrin